MFSTMQVETQLVLRKQFPSHFFSVLTRPMPFIQTIRMYTLYNAVVCLNQCAIMYFLINVHVVDNPNGVLHICDLIGT